MIDKLTLHNGLHSPMKKSFSESHLNIDDKLKLIELNNRYKEKFGFPFVMCPKDTDYRAIFSEMLTRIQNSQETEINVAMREVKNIVRLRIQELVEWIEFGNMKACGNSWLMTVIYGEKGFIHIEYKSFVSVV